jgi:glycerol uptake facilitator-like aquaporin
MTAAAVPPLTRRLVAEFLGTGLLVAVVVGSGIAAETLSTDVGLQLLENAFATAGGLAVLLVMLGPISGGHFNPAVSAADWFLGRKQASGLSARELCAYVGAQMGGGVAVLANAMFAEPLIRWSTKDRSASHLLLSEVVATAGLVLLIFALARNGRASASAVAVGAYIGAAYWWTSSTSFANPAVTVGRALSDSFAGIAPASVPGFVVAQTLGLAVGTVLVLILYPDAGRSADAVVVRHPASQAMASDPAATEPVNPGL